MSKIDAVATELNNGSKNLTRKIKTYAFDVIAVGLVISVALLNLGAIELRDIGEEFLSVILEAVPFYLGSVALALNFYKKGVYAAKETQGYKNIVNDFSKKVTALTGRQIDRLSEFCCQYNAKALRIKQEAILRDVAISYERFDKYSKDEEGHKVKPLKIISEDELKTAYGKTIAKRINAAKNVTIKGLSPNNVLGNMNTDDITDLGKNESEMLKDRSKEYSIVYFVSIFVMSLMGVKDVLQWGWVGAFLLLFKLTYILCRSYMKYFEGFDDISISLSNHLSRKSDVLKEFDYWYKTNVESLGNNSENLSYNNNERLQNG